jgi:hypothetical protein
MPALTPFGVKLALRVEFEDAVVPLLWLAKATKADQGGHARNWCGKARHSAQKHSCGKNGVETHGEFDDRYKMGRVTKQEQGNDR